MEQLTLHLETCASIELKQAIADAYLIYQMRQMDLITTEEGAILVNNIRVKLGLPARATKA